MQKNQIQTNNTLSSTIGYYEPEGSSLLANDNPRWVGVWAKYPRNDRRRNISATIGLIFTVSCSLLIQIYIVFYTFV